MIGERLMHREGRLMPFAGSNLCFHGPRPTGHAAPSKRIVSPGS